MKSPDLKKLQENQDFLLEPDVPYEELQIFYKNMSEENYTIIQQLSKFLVQNCFKNLLRELKETVNKYEKIYDYVNPHKLVLNRHNLNLLTVHCIEKPNQD